MIRRKKSRLVLLGDVTLAPTCRIESMPIGSHCIARRSGRITIGHRTRIGSGAAISSQESVAIGSDVAIGSCVVIQDNDFHTVGEEAGRSTSRAVRIDDGVVIGHSVTILPGAILGAGCEVRSGSVVGGEVPAGDVVGGNPARSSSESGHEPRGLAQILSNVLSLEDQPASATALSGLPGFDSLMMLRLLIEIEENHGIWLDQQVMAEVETIGDLETLVDTLA